MKKYLWLMVLVMLLALGTASLASADGGPHGGYTATTDACAGCHRAHTASGARLLVQTSYNLCVSCHGSTGLGANTNVDDGLYLASRDDTASDDDHGATLTPDNAALLGGGFDFIGGVATTSSHDPTGAESLSWGNGVARGATAALAGSNLTCASCHDPHGSNNYRIMKETINGNAVAIALVDEAAKDYDTENWGTGMSEVCAACHDDYHQTAVDQGSTLDGATYTHRVDMQWDAQFAGAVNPESVGMSGFTVPLALTDNPGAGDGVVVCQTCHLPHGTSAAMSGLADGTYDPDGAGPLLPIPSGDSALLRLDNRGTCEVCHQK